MDVHQFWKSRCLLALTFVLPLTTAFGGEDATAPALPKATPQPTVPATPATPATQGADRPKIRYWLEDPAGQSSPNNAAKPGEPTAPGRTVIDAQRGQPLVIKDTADIDVTEEERAARKAMLNAEIRLKLEQCKRLLKKKDYDAVLRIAQEIQKADPRNLEALEYIRQSQNAFVGADLKRTEVAGEERDARSMVEVEQHSTRPLPRLPEVRPHFPRRNEDPTLGKRLSMHQRLEQRIEAMDFMKADLEYVMSTLFLLTGVNIIVDPAAIEDKTLTLHVEDIPLRAVLDFIVRTNEGLTYSVTDDAIWVTGTESTEMKKLMFPRIYPLHFGLVSTAENSGASSGGGGGGGGGGGAGQRGGGTGRAGGGRGGGSSGGGAAGGGAQEMEASYIETVLKWMKDGQDVRVFPEGSDYLVDRQSNQLIVYTTATGHDYVRELLDAFDQPAIQVLIKARFLDISGLNEKELGINLDSLKTRTGDIALNNDTGTDTDGNTDGDTASRFNPGKVFDFKGGTAPILSPVLGPGNIFTILGRRTDPQFQVTLKALLQSRATKVLSEPQVLAINNKEAIIDITQHFSYVTDLRPVTTTSGVGDGNTVTSVPAFVPEFDEENIGFTLVVTPSVGRDLKTINLHLNPVVDELAAGQSIQQFQSFDASIGTDAASEASIQRPTINQTSLETDVVLEDNGYVIIGGLMRNFKETRERKIPGLHRIPYLGNLFKTKSNSVDRRNLMIIVEAQIISPGGRTYYKEPELDDTDPREGGTNRSPGQISDNTRGETQNSRVHPPLRVAETSRGGTDVKIPATPKKAAGSNSLVDNRGLVPAVQQTPSKPSSPSAAPKVSTPQERMERLARASRMQQTRTTMPKVNPNGWTAPQEEVGSVNEPRAETVPQE